MKDSQNQSDDFVCEQVLVSIRRIIRAIDLHSRMLLQTYGLTAPQLAVLQTLAQMKEVTVGELARQVHLSQGTVTGVLQRLEKRGLVTRARGDRDRRLIWVQATPAADELLENRPSVLQDQFLRQFKSLPDWEKSLILSSLQRIVAMMEADSLDVMPILETGPINKDDSAAETRGENPAPTAPEVESP